MEKVFQAFFSFTDYVVHNFWHIVWSVIILMIVWALVRSLVGTIITDTAEIFRKAFGRGRQGSRKKKARVEEPTPQAEPQPIMVAHPLDIKDEASRRLFEEEVEKEKERMRIRTHTD